MTEETNENRIICPLFDGKEWGKVGVCTVVRNWGLRGTTNSNCTEQDQQDFFDFHGPIVNVTKEYGPLYDSLGLVISAVDINRRLLRCRCPMVSKDAGNNR